MKKFKKNNNGMVNYYKSNNENYVSIYKRDKLLGFGKGVFL